MIAEKNKIIIDFEEASQGDMQSSLGVLAYSTLLSIVSMILVALFYI